MSYETVILRTKKIEGLLNKMGAEGKGLHEKATSVEKQLDESVIKKIRYIATIRNKLMHVDGFELDQDTLENFINTCNQVENSLSYKSDSSSKGSIKGDSNLFEDFKNASTIGKVAVVGAGIAALAFSVLSS